MILLLGGTGFVGTAFLKFLERERVKYISISRGEVDYSSRQTLRAFLRKNQIRFLVNCAGYTGKPNVDACEDNRTECILGNAVLPGLIHEECQKAGIPYGHVSSGCIFSGSRPNGFGFREEDIPNFSFRSNHCSFYSGCKALGEEALGYRDVVGSDGILRWDSEQKSGYVWRLRIPFSEEDSPRNYLSKLLSYSRLLDAKNSISHLDEFVQACWQLWDSKAPMGVYNIVNPGPVTTREVVDLILEAGLWHEQQRGLNPFRKEFDFFASEEEFMTTAAIAPRSNCVLDSSKLSHLEIHLRPVREALLDSLKQWKQASSTTDVNSSC